MVELRRICADEQLYVWAVEQLSVSFPACERRDEAEQRAVMAHPDYRLCAIMDGGVPVGVVGYFDTPEFIYFENFCISPDKRNGGYGSQALRLLTITDKPFILEIEPPEDELTRRRLALRNGGEPLSAHSAALPRGRHRSAAHGAVLRLSDNTGAIRCLPSLFGRKRRCKRTAANLKYS